MLNARLVEATFASAGARTEPKSELTDEQWSLIEDLFRDPPPSPQGGRPRVPARDCFEAILWVLQTGARWKDLPRSFPSPVTCWRRFHAWTKSGLWARAWSRLLRSLERRGVIDTEQAIADGTCSPAKKGAAA